MYISLKKGIIKDKNLKPQEIYLLLHLINLCDENGELSISVKNLMNEVRFSNRAMTIKYLDNLAANNYIEKILGIGVNNKYKINKEIYK